MPFLFVCLSAICVKTAWKAPGVCCRWHSLNASISLLLWRTTGDLTADLLPHLPTSASVLPLQGQREHPKHFCGLTGNWGLPGRQKLNIPGVSENHRLSSQSGVSAAEVSTRFWKKQCSISPQVNQSGYKNRSDDFCASQERPVPVPDSSLPNPAAGFAWVASLQHENSKG